MFYPKVSKKKFAISLSFLLSVTLMLMKFWAYRVTGSKAIFTDAMESIVNIIASGFAFYSIYLAEQPRDQNHLYGHGKIEFFSAGLEGTLIMVAGVFTFIPALQSIYYNNYGVENIPFGIRISAIVMFLNGALGLWLSKVGENEKSITLQSDGKHLILDALSSVGLIIGLLLVSYTGQQILDPIFAIIFAIYILFNGFKILKSSISGLMDESDITLIEDLIKIINSKRKDVWIDIHNFRVMKYGSDIHIDCHLTLPYYLSLKDAHDEVSNFEKIFENSEFQSVELFVHSDPCLPECCSYCNVKNCEVRSEEINKNIIWDINTLIKNQKHFEY